MFYKISRAFLKPLLKETLRNKIFVRYCSCDGETSSEESVFSSFSNRKTNTPPHKVSVIGLGNVGKACAAGCLHYGVTTDLCLYDVQLDMTRGEAMDFQHGSLFVKGVRVFAAKDIEETANSKLVIITAGVKQTDGKKRPQLMAENTEVVKGLIPDILKYSPNTTFLIATNPVDSITYVIWKLSGLPLSKVIGSGTNLDSSRFRYFIAEKMNLNVNNCHGYVIGEHGDTSVPVWSSVSIGGMNLRAVIPDAGVDASDSWNELHKRTVQAAYDVINLKGHTSWAIGYSLGQLAAAIMKNTQTIHCVVTNLKGFYGIEDDVFSSLPCIIGSEGINTVIKLNLTDLEVKLLHKSVDAIRIIQSSAKM